MGSVDEWPDPVRTRGFHLASCADNRDDRPASAEWCAENCPRLLHAQASRLRGGLDDAATCESPSSYWVGVPAERVVGRCGVCGGCVTASRLAHLIGDDDG
jgi:hypothetical protein